MEKSKLRGAVSAAGRSIQEIILEELDETMDELMEDGSGAEPEARGYARGLTYALAVIRNPYKIKKSIRITKEEAVARWEERQGTE